MTEYQIQHVLEASEKLWWWQRWLVKHRLHGVLRQLMLERRILYLRYEGQSRRRTDKTLFKYSLAYGDTSVRKG